jgi:hypothetical protein
MDYSSKLNRLVSKAVYLERRGHIFPSMESLKWFIRMQRDALTDAGAIATNIKHGSLIDPLAFDEVIVQSLFRSGVQAERVEGQAP